MKRKNSFPRSKHPVTTQSARIFHLAVTLPVFMRGGIYGCHDVSESTAFSPSVCSRLFSYSEESNL
jgi:hypothetical protein